MEGAENKINFNKSLFSVFNNLFEKKEKKNICSLIGWCGGADKERELQYILRRLVRGLGSARVHNQATSYASLSCIFTNVKTIIIFPVIIKELENCKNCPASEDAEYKLSAVLVCGALIHAGLYSKAKKKIPDFLTYLIVGKTDKTYLRYLSYKFLCEVITQNGEEELLQHIWPLISTDFVSWDDQNLDSLNFLFLGQNISEKFCEIVKQKLGPIQKSSICNILLLNQSVIPDHPCIEEAAKFLSRSKELLIKFWSEEIGQSLDKLTYNKELRVVSLFVFILKYLNHVSVVPMLLSPAFITVLVESVQILKSNKEKSLLQQRGKQAVDSLIQILNKESVKDKTRIEVIKKLLSGSGDVNFERKTGTRCIQLINQQLSTQGVKKLAEFYGGIVKGDIDVESKQWVSREKVYILHGLVKLLNHSAMKEELEWKTEILKLIFELAFTKQHPVTYEVTKQAKDCFYSALNLNLPSLDQLISLLTSLVAHIDVFIKNKKLLLEEKEQAWNEMLALLEQAKKKKRKNYKVLYVLSSHMGLQLFKDFALAKENLEELQACFKRMEKKQKDDEEPQWIEVTLDLLLLLLSKENKLYRHVISCIFPQLSYYVNANCIQQIVDALNPNSDDKDNSDEDMESGSEEENDEDSSEEEEDSLDEEEEEMTVNDQLRMAVRGALGRSGAATDDESEDMDNMDPQEEQRLNEQLGQAFKMLKKPSNNKKKQSKEEAVLMHFRIRVLDLIDIYANNEPSMGCCVDLILPLYRLLENSIKDERQKPLQNRLESVLKKLSNVKKFSTTDSVDDELLVTVMKTLLNQEDTSGGIYSEMSQCISDTCVFLVRCSIQLTSEDNQGKSNSALAKIVVELLERFFKGRESKFSVNMFETIIKINWNGNWKLVKLLYKLVFDENIRLFKKNKIVDLINNFYHNHRLLANSSDKQKKILNKLEEEFMSELVNYLHTNEDKLAVITRQHEAFLLNLLQLIHTSYNSWMKFRKETSIPPWRTLFEAIKDMRNISFTKPLKRKLLHLSSLFDVDLTHLKSNDSTSKKRKISETESQNENVENKKKKKEKKKKKNSKATAQLKQQSQSLRNEMSSQGLEVIKFSQTVLDPSIELDE